MATGLLLDATVQKHDTGVGHPESAERVTAVKDALEERELLQACRALERRDVSTEELLAVHTEAYLELVTREIERGKTRLSTGDTMISPSSLEAARAASGGVLRAVDEVLNQEVDNAFCVIRPPGHHASAGTGMGFCIFNHVAVAARHAQKQHGVERVAIVDWDVHHGNGTQEIFYEDDSVHYFSTHQAPWFPGTGWPEETGSGPGAGKTLNLPFPAGSGMEELGTALREDWTKAMRDFRPDLILISAGFDSRRDDPLGKFLLEDEDFRELTLRVMDAAEKTSEHRVVSVLEGGYNLSGLGGAASAHLETLLGSSTN